MFLEIITPEKKIFEGEVISATFLGVDGSFQVLNNHAPMISVIGRGLICYTEEKKEEIRFLVGGGAVEIINNKVNVLVEEIFQEESIN